MISHANSRRCSPAPTPFFSATSIRRANSRSMVSLPSSSRRRCVLQGKPRRGKGRARMLARALGASCATATSYLTIGAGDITRTGPELRAHLEGARLTEPVRSSPQSRALRCSRRLLALLLLAHPRAGFVAGPTRCVEDGVLPPSLSRRWKGRDTSHRNRLSSDSPSIRCGRCGTTPSRSSRDQNDAAGFRREDLAQTARNTRRDHSGKLPVALAPGPRGLEAVDSAGVVFRSIRRARISTFPSPISATSEYSLSWVTRALHESASCIAESARFAGRTDGLVLQLAPLRGA